MKWLSFTSGPARGDVESEPVAGGGYENAVVYRYFAYDPAAYRNVPSIARHRLPMKVIYATRPADIARHQPRVADRRRVHHLLLDCARVLGDARPCNWCWVRIPLKADTHSNSKRTDLSRSCKWLSKGSQTCRAYRFGRCPWSCGETLPAGPACTQQGLSTVAFCIFRSARASGTPHFAAGADTKLIVRGTVS
jgi:hypothetical protein